MYWALSYIHGIVVGIQVSDEPPGTFAYKESLPFLFVPYSCLHFLRFAIIFAVVFSCIIIYFLLAGSAL